MDIFDNLIIKEITEMFNSWEVADRLEFLITFWYSNSMC